jgi:SAM-dependent methyltransferase/uncharacterized protein YbaR (Trm112 family)
MELKASLLNKLVCPVDKCSLTQVASPGIGLTCPHAHFYPVVDGVPIMLTEGASHALPPIMRARTATIADGPLYLDTVLLSDEEKAGIQKLANKGSAVDPVAAYLVGATNGIAYKHLIGTLSEYPIPEIGLPEGNGKSLLDVGCSWGRWSVAAARKGYKPIGLDPSLGAVMAARRVARDLNVDAEFVVGDARYLPFQSGIFDQAYSYSVLQHLSCEHATQCLDEIGRVLAEGGRSLVQMPTRYGIRCLYNQVRRGFRDAQGFEVRYWSVPELQHTFSRAIGSTAVSVDCFFGIGWQASDAHLMPPIRKAVLRASQVLTAVARYAPLLKYVADSVYLDSQKTGLTAMSTAASP